MTARKRLHPDVDVDDFEEELATLGDDEASPVKRKVVLLTNNKLSPAPSLALCSS